MRKNTGVTARDCAMDVVEDVFDLRWQAEYTTEALQKLLEHGVAEVDDFILSDLLVVFKGLAGFDWEALDELLARVWELAEAEQEARRNAKSS